MEAQVNSNHHRRKSKPLSSLGDNIFPITEESTTSDTSAKKTKVVKFSLPPEISEISRTTDQRTDTQVQLLLDVQGPTDEERRTQRTNQTEDGLLLPLSTRALILDFKGEESPRPRSLTPSPRTRVTTVKKQKGEKTTQGHSLEFQLDFHDDKVREVLPEQVIGSAYNHQFDPKDHLQFKRMPFEEEDAPKYLLKYHRNRIETRVPFFTSEFVHSYTSNIGEKVYRLSVQHVESLTATNNESQLLTRDGQSEKEKQVASQTPKDFTRILKFKNHNECTMESSLSESAEDEDGFQIDKDYFQVSEIVSESALVGIWTTGTDDQESQFQCVKYFSVPHPVYIPNENGQFYNNTNRHFEGDPPKYNPCDQRGHFIFKSKQMGKLYFFFMNPVDNQEFCVGVINSEKVHAHSNDIKQEWSYKDYCDVYYLGKEPFVQKVIKRYFLVADQELVPPPSLSFIRGKMLLVMHYRQYENQASSIVFLTPHEKYESDPNKGFTAAHTQRDAFLFAGFDQYLRIVYFTSKGYLFVSQTPIFHQNTDKEESNIRCYAIKLDFREQKYGLIQARLYDTEDQKDNVLVIENNNMSHKFINMNTRFIVKNRNQSQKEIQKELKHPKMNWIQERELFQDLSIAQIFKYDNGALQLVLKLDDQYGTLTIQNEYKTSSKKAFTIQDPWYNSDRNLLTAVLKIKEKNQSESVTTLFFTISLDAIANEKIVKEISSVETHQKFNEQPVMIYGNCLSYVGSAPDSKQIVTANLESKVFEKLYLGSLTFIAWVFDKKHDGPIFLGKHQLTKQYFLCQVLSQLEFVKKTEIKGGEEFLLGNLIKSAHINQNYLLVQTTENIAVFDIDDDDDDASSLDSLQRCYHFSHVLCPEQKGLEMGKCFMETFYSEAHFYVQIRDDTQLLQMFYRDDVEKVYEHKEPTRIIALQIDAENSNYSTKKSDVFIYLLDELLTLRRVQILTESEPNWKVHQVYSELTVKHPKLKPEPIPLSWMTVQIDSKTISIDGCTYGLESPVSELYFHKREKGHFQMVKQLQNNLNELTIGMLAKKNHRYYFSLKPSPGTQQFTRGIASNKKFKILTFVTNEHILVRVSAYDALDMMYHRLAVVDIFSGLAVTQSEEVGKILDAPECEMVIQSDLVNGRKYVLLEYVAALADNGKKVLHRKLVKFSEDGQGEVVIKEDSCQQQKINALITKRYQKVFDEDSLPDGGMKDYFEAVKSKVFLSNSGQIIEVEVANSTISKPKVELVEDGSREGSFKKIQIPFYEEFENWYDLGSKLKDLNFLKVGHHLVVWEKQDQTIRFIDLTADTTTWKEHSFQDPKCEKQQEFELYVDKIPTNIKNNYNIFLDHRLRYRHNLVQVTLSDMVFQFDLDYSEEVSLLEHTRDLRVMSGSDYHESVIVPRNLKQNEKKTFVFDTKDEEGDRLTVYSPFSEWDLILLVEHAKRIKNKKEPQTPSVRWLTTCFYGHTFFSLFHRDSQSYQQALDTISGWQKQMRKEEEQAQFRDDGKQKWEQTQQKEKACLFRLYSVLTRQVLDYKKKAPTTEVSYKPILNKCAYEEKNSNYLVLVQLMEYCQENYAQFFIWNQKDFKMLTKNYGPTAKKLLENCFITTEYTKRVQDEAHFVDPDQMQHVFYHDSYQVSQQSIKEARPKNWMCRQSNSKQLVKYKQLRIDWVFRAGQDWNSLVGVLSQAPIDIFTLPVVQVLIQSFWKRCQLNLTLLCFIPYVWNLQLMIYYCRQFVFAWEAQYSSGYRLLVEITLIVNITWQLFIEVFQIVKMRKSYFANLWNWVDMVTTILNIYVMFVFFGRLDFSYDRADYVAASLSIFLMWCKVFYWLRLFHETSFYIRLIKQTIVDLKYFIILVLIIIFAFGSFFYIINAAGEHFHDTDKMYIDAFDSDFINSSVSIYLQSLGYYDFREYGPNQSIAWIFLLTSSFLVQVVFMNMLIAIMGNTFENVLTQQELLAKKTKIEIVTGYVKIFPFLVNRPKKDKILNYLRQLNDQELAERFNSSDKSTLSKLPELNHFKIKQIQKKIDVVQHKMDVHMEQFNYKLNSKLDEATKRLEEHFEYKLNQIVQRLEPQDETKKALNRRRSAMVPQRANPLKRQTTVIGYSGDKKGPPLPI